MMGLSNLRSASRWTQLLLSPRPPGDPAARTRFFSSKCMQTTPIILTPGSPPALVIPNNAPLYAVFLGLLSPHFLSARTGTQHTFYKCLPLLTCTLSLIFLLSHNPDLHLLPLLQLPRLRAKFKRLHYSTRLPRTPSLLRREIHLRAVFCKQTSGGCSFVNGDPRG